MKYRFVYKFLKNEKEAKKTLLAVKKKCKSPKLNKLTDGTYEVVLYESDSYKEMESALHYFYRVGLWGGILEN